VKARRIAAPAVDCKSAATLNAAVLEDFRGELQRMVSGGRLGVHLGQLIDCVRGDRPNLRELLHYGMSRLPLGDSRPDDALAVFFIVLSELRHVPAELRVFVTKCVEYCESEALDGWSESLPQLRKAYRALLRHLHRLREP
jgi:hypothetical protein